MATASARFLGESRDDVCRSVYMAEPVDVLGLPFSVSVFGKAWAAPGRRSISRFELGPDRFGSGPGKDRADRRGDRFRRSLRNHGEDVAHEVRPAGSRSVWA